MLAAHRRDRAKSTQPVAALGDLEVGIVARRDAEPRGVFEGSYGSGPEQAPLLLRCAAISPPCQRTVQDPADLLASEHADDVIDARHFLEPLFLLAFCQAARDN